MKRSIRANFRYPRIGARIKVMAEGFNPERIGYYTGNDHKGDLILDMDPENHLPEDRKFETISQFSDFEVT